MITNYNSFSYLLLLLFPFAILTGSFFVNFISILLAITYLINIKVFTNKKFFQENLYLFIFFLVCLISSLLSDYKLHSFRKTIAFVGELVFLLAIINMVLKNNEKQLITLSKIVFFISIFICIDLWFQWYFKENILGYPIQQAGRLTSIFGDEQIPGSIIFKFLPFILYFLLSIKKKNFFYKLKYLIFIFIYFSIFVTGERAASILATLFIFLLIVLNYKFLNKKKLLVYFMIFMSIFMFLFYSKESIVKQRIDFTINNQIHNNIYEKLYANAISVFYKNPLFGSGVQTYRFECKKIGTNCSTHPHNYILELLSDIGLFGFLSFFIYIFFIIKKKLKSVYENIFLKNLIIICSICFFFPFIPTGSIFSSFSYNITLFSLGFVLSIGKKNLFFNNNKLN